MTNMRVLLASLLALGALAAPAAARPLPDVIHLPNGFGPEGLTSQGKTFYTGSIATGAILRGNFRTGVVHQLVPPHSGRSSLGMEIAGRRLFVAGGQTGDLFVYNARTGADVASFDVHGGFVNDVVVTRRGAFFTDSAKKQLYVLRHGHARTLPLTGDVVYDDNPGTFELNGIDATRHGRVLISIQSRNGDLFRINPRTGVTRQIHVTGGDLTNGDGILLRGRTLYVVRNQNNQIAVVKLGRRLHAGRVVRTLTNPNLDVPTGITAFRGSLYAVNAKFGQTGPDVPYEVVRVAKR
jgi:outer membrane protein assembly factor BamB